MNVLCTYIEVTPAFLIYLYASSYLKIYTPNHWDKICIAFYLSVCLFFIPKMKETQANTNLELYRNKWFTHADVTTVFLIVIYLLI